MEHDGEKDVPVESEVGETGEIDTVDQIAEENDIIGAEDIEGNDKNEIQDLDEEAEENRHIDNSREVGLEDENLEEVRYDVKETEDMIINPNDKQTDLDEDVIEEEPVQEEQDDVPEAGDDEAQNNDDDDDKDYTKADQTPFGTKDIGKRYNPRRDENKENGGAGGEENNNSVKGSIAKFGAPVKQEKGMFKVVQTEKCAACQKTVYAMEKLEMNGHIYHKNCFKCSHCSARLTPKTFSMNEGVIYCVNHFKQLFARKGNYDEGFGRQQYKKKWGAGEKSEGATA